MNSSPSFSKVDIDERKWVDSMRKSITEYQGDSKTTVCVFTVPKMLLATDPKCYIPQQVALGPYYHWQVYDMQSYKLAAVQRTYVYMNVSFEDLVEIMKKHDEARIRACYHKYLDINCDTLMWMLAIDVAFLLEFLQVCFMKEESRDVLKEVDYRMPHAAILRDVVMVENQIPLFLVKTMLEHQVEKTSGHLKSADETLKTMLMRLYQELTPFNEQQLPDVDIAKCDHLLDYLYRMTVQKKEEHGIKVEELGNTQELHNMQDQNDIENEQTTESPNREVKEESFPKGADFLKTMKWIVNILLSINVFRIPKMRKPVAVGKELLSNNLIGNLIKQHSEQVIDVSEPKAPTKEEITIPSVTQMAKAGFHFKPVDGGDISKISFDRKTHTLHLPVVELDVNTRVYLRNLVAYEACVANGELVIARYTELMNGIIDTEQDAKYLQERKIVLNRLKSDIAVADLWNGMSKSVKLTKVDYLDKVIVDVNKVYEQTWRVKSSKYLKKYVFASWKILTLFATLFMLFLTAVQAFCSVYSCVRVLRQLPAIPPQVAE